MRALVAGIDWWLVGEIVALVLWDVTKLTAKLSMMLVWVAFVVPFAMLALFIGGRFPWFVRKWF